MIPVSTFRLWQKRWLCNTPDTAQLVHIEGRRFEQSVQQWSVPATLRTYHILLQLGMRLLVYGGGPRHIAGMQSGTGGIFTRCLRVVFPDTEIESVPVGPPVIIQTTRDVQKLSMPDDAHLIIIGLDTWVSTKSRAFRRLNRDLVPRAAYTEVRLTMHEYFTQLDNPVALWSLFLLFGYRAPHEFFPWALRYCAAKETPSGWLYSVGNIAELRTELDSFTLR